ncbi:MAG: ABC transporter ATP-binding protein [Flammeovirgaceae bacterium]
MDTFRKIFGVEAKRPNPRQNNMSFKENMLALRTLPKFFKLIWTTSKSMTIGNFLLRLVKAGLPLSMLYVGKLIIDEIIRLAETEGGDMTTLWTYVGIEFALVFITALLSRLINLLDALLGDLFANQTSVMLIEKAAQLDLPQFEDSEFYDKLERARRQTTSRVALMSDVLTQIQDFITIIFLAGGLIAFNPWLLLILLLSVLPVFLSETYFNQQSYSLVRNWTPERRELDYLRFIGASDDTAKEVKIFGLAEFLKNRFALVANNYYQANKKLALKRSTWALVFNSLGDTGYYVAYIFIILETIQGKLSIGDLTFLAGSFSQMRNLLQGILSRFSNISQRALYLQDLFDFFDIKPEIQSPEHPESLPLPFQQGFTFENVGFKYPNTDEWAVRNVSFHLNIGEKLALVGENGAGKTTLVKLLARLYDPNEGRILLDGQDIRNFNLKAYRELIGVIFQDFVRFQFMVSENIAVGKINEKDDKERIIESAQLSLADTVIEGLPNKYEQILGKRFENGVELSGGQWQKIALGRAYMRNAQLLILDEPTAALDARAEYEVFQRFSSLTQGKTAVLISHRFSTVRMADRILVLNKGQMEEIGSHEELLAKKGTYAELFELQAEGYR